MTKLNPYLSFKDQAKAALEFYQSVLGGELDVTTFGDMPDMPGVPEGEGGLVMHGHLETPGGLTLMASDTGTMMPYVPATSGVTVALTGAGAADLDYVRSAYEKLLDGATETLPFELAPWGDHYGQLTDKFGVSWMFDVGEAG
ncbi:3-demethylubiquinone-9 3-methyltransferase [Xylanimonas cellulosilytica DSM 15894]|uniref:3-demethylubiquinone-9 3-methyltransferase n=1 Tax=Xylanimonas cellulosilytica (strain DSM 15894 / JCM 12276 / CECT 5975 / KCTC 9989 / LMG 20990 / NBRC 107835 / XIL07) TaxID=446471 RepID=D1BZB2_XYLCX|nr:VOC family protein [Xylanimonas cellulosilytica]ACZ32009.1 3-demethylubiquinone-9 3-methyltransferase [Xylanimonas cellulosilytica DSM 15894]